MPLRLWSQTLWNLGPGATGVSLYKQYKKRTCIHTYIYIYIYIYIHTQSRAWIANLDNWNPQLGNNSCILILSLLLTYLLFFFMAQQSLVGKGLIIIEASRSHSDTPHSVGVLGRLIGPSQKPLPDKSQHSQKTCIHAPGGIRTRNPCKRAAVDPSPDRAATGIGNLFS